MKCIECSKEIKKNKTGYCRTCYKPTRCEDCGQLLAQGKPHECASVDLKGDRHCSCGQLLKNNGWERWSSICRKCSKSQWREIERKERRQFKIVFGGKCSKCGYDKCWAALHFHHKDGGIEKYDFSKKTGASLKELRQYPERFELLCACCHIQTHWPDE